MDDSRRARTLGFALGILGVTIYVAGAFRPYAGAAAGGSTVIERIFSRSANGVDVGVAFITYFGAAAIVLGICIAGLRDDRRGTWRVALFGASSVWFVPSAGYLVAMWRSPFRLGAIALVVFAIGSGVSFAGGIAALISVRSDTSTVDALPTPAVRSAVLGFRLALCGALLFLVASFLPYGSFSASGSLKISLHDEVQLGHDIGMAVGQTLSVYGMAAVIAAFAVGGLLGRRRSRWAAALMAAAAIWGVGLVVEIFSHPIFSPMIGYWGAQLAIALALAGGIVAAVPMSRRALS